MITCVNDPIDGRGGGQSPLPTSEVKVACDHRPHIVYIAMLWPCHVSPRGPNGARTCATLLGGGGVMAHTPTHAKCSHAKLRHTRLPCAPFNKS